jgi:hypothetical protein
MSTPGAVLVRGMVGMTNNGVTNRGRLTGSREPPGTACASTLCTNPNFDVRYNPEPPNAPAFKKSRRVAIGAPFQ